MYQCSVHIIYIDSRFDTHTQTQKLLTNCWQRQNNLPPFVATPSAPATNRNLKISIQRWYEYRRPILWILGNLNIMYLDVCIYMHIYIYYMYIQVFLGIKHVPLHLSFDDWAPGCWPTWTWASIGHVAAVFSESEIQLQQVEAQTIGKFSTTGLFFSQKKANKDAVAVVLRTCCVSPFFYAKKKRIGTVGAEALGGVLKTSNLQDRIQVVTSKTGWKSVVKTSRTTCFYMDFLEIQKTEKPFST